MKRFRFAWLMLVTVLGGAVALPAQTSQGRILGSVADQTGAVVAGAKVTITNTATGAARVLTTNSGGEYFAPNLDPGPYAIVVEGVNFEKVNRSGVRLEVARDARVDFKLVPGAVNQVINVSEAAPLVDTTSDVLGGTFSNEAITELPLLGRDFQNLAILQPGIQRSPGGGFLSITANGNRPEDNNFIVDGLDDNDAYYGTTVINAEGVAGTPATHLPIDAIQEFNIQSSPEADYGYKPGAIINVGIKAGTNSFHGSTYYFNRNAALDARNWFNPGPDPVAALNLHQFGASAGGPIVKDKLFLFANYEGVRDVVGNPLAVLAPISVSSASDTDDSLPDALARCAATSTCSRASAQLGKLLPYNPGPTTTLNLDLNNRNREDNGIAKLDYHLSEKHSFVGTYFMGDSAQTEEDTTVLNPLFLSVANTRAQVAGGGWIWVPTSRFTNQLRVGYNRFWQQDVVADHNRNPTTFGLNTGVVDPANFGLPEIRISGFEQHTLGGNESWPLYTTPNQTLQFNDSASYVAGKHNLRLGGEFRTGSSDNLRNTFGSGEIRFASLDDFVTGNIRSGNFVFVGNDHRVVSQKSVGLFIQDDWRVTPKLTVNAGLRYDLSLPIHEQNDLLSNFDPAVGLEQVGKQISQPYPTSYHNFAPRFAVALDPFGNGKTVLRGGAGIIYEIPHISVYIGQNSTNAIGLGGNPTGVPGAPTGPGGGTIVATTISPDPDTMSTNWQTGAPVFGDLSPDQAVCSTDSPCPILGTVPHLTTPYVINWNLNVEQVLWKNASTTIAYVGNKGNKLYSLRDINQNIYAHDLSAQETGFPDEQTGRPYNTRFPTLSNIYQLGNGDSSIYHGLQVTVRQRTSNGLYFVAGYTFAHSIDDADSNRQFNIQNSYDPAAERSNSNDDIRHRLTFASTYELPSRPGYGQLLQGWRLNGIMTVQTGSPIFFYDSSNDISGTGAFNDHWNITGNPGDIHWSPTVPIPYIDPSQFNTVQYDADNGYYHVTGATNPVAQRCLSQALATGGQAAADELVGGIDESGTGGCYVSGSAVITPPAPGRFGNMKRNIVYGPGFVNLDFSVIKTFKFGERLALEARGEVFNILNHPNFADPDHDLSDGATLGLGQYTPDVYASNPVMGSGGSRHLQIGAKIIW
jgi:Carboxypeptidase regulatory-like domain/TonB dependent receptor